MKSYFLKLTGALVIDGNIATRGSIVEVSELEAKNFLARGKAVLATAADGVEQPEDEEEAEEQSVDLSRLNKAKLLEHAHGLSLDVTDAMTKAQLIEAIEEAQ